MRHLLQPRVLNMAGTAAFISALACYPRLSLWLHGPAPVWYLEATIFICCIVLWGFVFAWHEPYTNRPVFIFQFEPASFITATVTGLVAATAYHLWLDPSLRSKLPEDYPRDWEHWSAMLLFVLCFNQLFSTFAPFDWLMRLAKNQRLAMGLTALLGASVQAMKIYSLAVPISPVFAVFLLALRVIGACLAVWFYLRGGVLLAWWWTFIFESRLVLDLDHT